MIHMVSALRLRPSWRRALEAAICWALGNAIDYKVEMAKKKSKTELFPIRYEKSSAYRVSYVDGAIASIAKGAQIDIDFWHTRKIVPSIVWHEMTQDNTLGPEKEREEEPGLVRILEAGITIDYLSAKALIALLERQVKLVEEKIAQLTAEDKKPQESETTADAS